MNSLMPPSWFLMTTLLLLYIFLIIHQIHWVITSGNDWSMTSTMVIFYSNYKKKIRGFQLVKRPSDVMKIQDGGVHPLFSRAFFPERDHFNIHMNIFNYNTTVTAFVIHRAFWHYLILIPNILVVIYSNSSWLFH